MTKQSKGFGKPRHNQEAENRDRREFDRRELDRFAKNFAENPISAKFPEVVTNPESAEKMSEVLIDFVNPYIDSIETDEQRKTLYNTAMLAWNLSFVALGQQSLMLEKAIAQICTPGNPSIQTELKERINQMITRKLKHFADNQRRIMEIQISDYGEQYHLSVASTLTQKT
jgi:hypothetical protein